MYVLFKKVFKRKTLDTNATLEYKKTPKNPNMNQAIFQERKAHLSKWKKKVLPRVVGSAGDSNSAFFLSACASHHFVPEGS